MSARPKTQRTEQHKIVAEIEARTTAIDHLEVALEEFRGVEEALNRE